MKDVMVTDHVLVRFLERVKGVDMAAVRAEIAGIVEGALGIGATKFTAGGITYVLDPKKRAIITVVFGTTPLAAFRRGRVLKGRSIRRFKDDRKRRHIEPKEDREDV